MLILSEMLAGGWLQGGLIPKNRRKNWLQPRIFGAEGAENLGKIVFFGPKSDIFGKNDNFCENFCPSYIFDEFSTAWL